IAISAEDNTLLALEDATGRVLWRYEVGQDISAPLTIVQLPSDPHEPPKVCGLLPTAEGEIHVVELSLGKPLGKYIVGQPMTVGGTYDPTTNLVYFAADRKRILALDPRAIHHSTEAACRSVLFTEHPSGSLRSPPTIVG